MDSPVVTMDVRHVDGVAVIDIEGEVTGSCERVLMAAYEAASSPQNKDIVLNFTGLEYMNSGGIGMLVTLLVRANRQRQKLAAVGLSEHYREILGLTRLDEAITIYETEGDAVSALSGSAGTVAR